MHPVERYLRELSDIRRSGAGTEETSFYPALAALLSEVGAGLKPWVRAVSQLANRGKGQPDFGLFEKSQFQRAGEAEPLAGSKPARGVVEAKGPSASVAKVAASQQTAKYLAGYGAVLVTNLREFLLVCTEEHGERRDLEGYSLAATEAEFWTEAVAHPRRTADRHGDRLLDYLRRVLLHRAPLSAPEDVAWFLASYAREAKARVEEAGDLPALTATRTALEESLGIRFEGEKGEHFFRSTLVQTLFYGVFSAWVLWAKDHPPTSRARFDWQKAAWTLRVPTIRALFSQVATPDRLGPLGVSEVLDWTCARLNDVDRAAFFERFGEEHAVQHFYEPFLQAFDPELRKRLGVWYTPPEVVQYMVARVDTVLREELDIPDGLADPRVHVLDPCCGTGAFLVEVLRKIAETLRAKGDDGLVASDLRRAAKERVHGFELLPAPFVVAHLQLGLLLAREGAPLSEKKGDRVGVFLTNALTGWEPPTEEAKKRLTQLQLGFPELAEERDAAAAVKRDAPILVVLGNPPYDGFAGVAEVEEERILADAYRTTKRAPKPEGQGLNDLYVRFFRMAERKIVEGTKRGVVCFISNYSWLDGLSHTGMRERYLEVFDKIMIDCLNGDKYKTGKLTPEGEPDPSVFSTEWNREGIQVGTAIATLIHNPRYDGEPVVQARQFWGRGKREALIDESRRLDLAGAHGRRKGTSYEIVRAKAELGFPLLPMRTAKKYFRWPSLPDLFPVYFPGVKTSRDALLVDIDRERLVSRMNAYFDPRVSDEEMERICPCALESTTGFNAKQTRRSLQDRGIRLSGFVQYMYRPFDLRWLYWEPDGKLLDRKRIEFHSALGRYRNFFLEAREKQPKESFDRGYVVKHLADNFGNGLSSFFPLYAEAHTDDDDFLSVREPEYQHPNVSRIAENYCDSIGVSRLLLLPHSVAVLHARNFREENAGALRLDWPRIPLPNEKSALEASAALGTKLIRLFDPQEDLHGVNSGNLRSELRQLASPKSNRGVALDDDAGDFAVTAGWGHAGKGGVTMPGMGRTRLRDYTPEELAAFGRAEGYTQAEVLASLGGRTLDVFLNDVACWRNVPERVWEYTLGGYQVCKKWLSYREKALLGRDLRVEEVRYFGEMVRRIAALLLLGQALDANYEAAKESTVSLG